MLLCPDFLPLGPASYQFQLGTALGSINSLESGEKSLN